jgi:hypothetical protein
VTDDADLEGVIHRIVRRVLAEPVSSDLLAQMRAYGNPESFLIWWLHDMGGDFLAYAKTLNNHELAESLDYNSANAKTDIMRAVMLEAARRLKDDPEPHFVEPKPPDMPPLKAYAMPD